nr:NADH-quinone oxidoreductase subunit J [Brasilonema bromeliae]
MLFALVACGSALAVVLSNNVVRMAVYLIFALCGTSGLFFLAGAEFVGAAQLMVYVGGTLVLLIFGVMLTSPGPFASLNTRPADWVLGLGVGGLLLAAVLIPAIFSVADWRPNPRADVELAAPRLEVKSAEIGLALIGVRADRVRDAEDPLAPGRSGWLLPFELSSVYLLVVLIGAAYLARAKRSARTHEA